MKNIGDKKMNILHLSDIHFGRNYPEYGIKDAFDKKEKILCLFNEKIKNFFLN